MNTLLYRCLNGSRLHGTYKPDSDYDWFEVWDKVPDPVRWTSDRASHKQIRDASGKVLADLTQVSLTVFMRNAANGAHQTLDAMFAPEEFSEVDMLTELRKGFRCNTPQTVGRYQRTIKSFWDTQHTDKRGDKAIKTALRMAYNLEDILQYARFNPRLTDSRIKELQGLTRDEAHAMVEQRLEALGKRFGL